MYSLEHFYYGQLVHRGVPKGDMRVLAKSEGMTDEQVADVIRHALLPAMKDGSNLSWGIVRGKHVPFVLVQSQTGKAGETTFHFVIVPSEALRALRGNIKAFLPHVTKDLPVYDRLGDKLVPLVINTAALETGEQVDDILDLMTYTGNRTKTLEAILSAIVKGIPLVVQNAPADMVQRTGFVQGMLTLLPSSTRFGIMFAMNVEKTTQASLQMMFSDTYVPDNAIVFDWESNTVSQDDLKDDYSRYIVSQLRLDAELALQRAEALTPVAGWRLRSGESLTDALAYASKRLRLDNALLNNQPVEAEEISAILAGDPTLTDDLRAVYSLHLLKFGLAMNKMDYADPIAVLLRHNQQLSDSARTQLNEAADGGDYDLVYETLLRWMTNPLGPSGADWVRLFHKSMLTFLKDVVDDADVEGVHMFLDDVQNVGPALAIGQIAPRLIQMLFPLIAQDESLGKRLLVVAFNHLSAEDLRKLLGVGRFDNHVPEPVEIVLARLKNGGGAPAGALVAAADALDDSEDSQILLRLVTMAHESGRHSLIDAPTLERLFQVVKTPAGALHADVLIELVKALHRDNLEDLEDPGPRYLLEILVALREYDLVTEYMFIQSRILYPGDKQTDYIRMVQKLFGEVILSPTEAHAAQSALMRGGVKGIPLVMCGVGLLEATRWSPELMDIAEDVRLTLAENPQYMSLVHPNGVLGLLRFYANLKDLDATLQVAEFVPTVAAHHPSSGRAVMARFFKMMQWDETAKERALEMLRQYVREADEQGAREAVQYFGRSMPVKIRQKLEMSYRINHLMNQLMVEPYARRLHTGVVILQDIVGAYSSKSGAPSAGELQRITQEMRKLLSDEEKSAMHEALVGLGKAITALNKQHPNGANDVDKVLAGKQNPRSVLDIWLIMGGYLSSGKAVSLQLEAQSSPFGGRSPEHVLEGVRAAYELINSAAHAIPTNRLPAITAVDIRDEVKSMMLTLPEDRVPVIRRALATDLQRVALLVQMIGKMGDVRVFAPDNATGRKIRQGSQAPQNPFEFFLYGATRFK